VRVQLHPVVEVIAMTEILNALLMVMLVLNLFTLGSSRMVTLIRIVAIQGVILGIIPLLLHEHLTIPVVIAAAAAVVIKSSVIPAIMMRALRDVQIKREVEPLVGFLPSLLLGALGTAGSLLFFSQLNLVNQADGLLIIPTSIATIIVGFILLTTRFKAITQVLGYLVLENGIFVFSLLLIEAIPLVVEMGMLLDLFVGIFVISIITNHINRAFSSLDTRNLVSLKEE
jgi:hydrogenase-4 component E